MCIVFCQASYLLKTLANSRHAQLITDYGPRAVVTMAGSSTDEKWTIEKLNGANWKFQMKHLLLVKELWGMVDTLAEDAATTARSDFQKKSQKAFSTLVLAIGTSQLYLVTSCETPKDVWDALRSHFERNMLANKLFLKKRFFRMEGTMVENHLKEMKKLSDQLSAIDAPIIQLNGKKQQTLSIDRLSRTKHGILSSYLVEEHP